jgi:hypothetical protein
MTGVGFGLIITVVLQVETLPHASVTVHVMIEVPILNAPLASVALLFVLVLSVAPVIT